MKYQHVFYRTPDPDMKNGIFPEVSACFKQLKPEEIDDLGVGDSVYVKKQEVGVEGYIVDGFFRVKITEVEPTEAGKLYVHDMGKIKDIAYRAIPHTIEALVAKHGDKVIETPL